MKDSSHLLVYEPRTEGHHLGWLRFITEDLLSSNRRLTLAVDLRPGKAGSVRDQLGDLQSSVTLINAYDGSGRRHSGGKSVSVATCLRQSGAANVFLCALDEIASHCWRRAAFGLRPPEDLRGRIGGIYHRPRFFAAPRWSPDRWLKQAGWERLLKEGWWRQLLFVDEFLATQIKLTRADAPVYFLPDACPPDYENDLPAARQQLQIPIDRQVMLFYGTGARRKGLHLAVAAMLELPENSPAFLLCAGQQNPTGKTADGIARLIRENRAKLMDRYVSLAEEKLCFAASDAVLLPYMHHFGTSGVLSRAMSAAKPVVVSDEQLLGRLTREHRLGMVFPSGNVHALRDSIQQMIELSPVEKNQFAVAARHFAGINSRSAFREVLLRSLAVS